MNMKKFILSVIAVFVVVAALDYFIHGILLADEYVANASLFRGKEEMKCGLIIGWYAMTALIFVLVYARFFAEKGLRTALPYGILTGVAFGYGIGYGIYAIMPISGKLAGWWFLSSLFELTAAGLALGFIYGGRVTETAEPPKP